MNGRSIRRGWTYFRIGHGTYLGFILSFIQFIILVYEFVIKSTSIGGFGILAFGVLFLSFYVPIAIIFGYALHTKGGFYDTDQKIASERNPLFREWSEQLNRIENKIEVSKNE